MCSLCELHRVEDEGGGQVTLQASVDAASGLNCLINEVCEVGDMLAATESFLQESDQIFC